MAKRNQRMMMKLTLLAGVIVGFIVLGLFFFLPTRVEVSTAAGSGSSESGFPWFVLMIAVVPILVTFIAVFQSRAADLDEDEPKRKEKPKRKPDYIQDAAGDVLEVIEDEDVEESPRA